MSKRAKIILISVAVALAIFLVFAFSDAVFGSDTKTTDELSYYRVLSGETEGTNMMPVFGTEYNIPCPYDLPLLSELEPYQDIRFNYTAKRESFFQSHAYILIASYDNEAYEFQKAALSGKYTFCTQQSQGFADGLMPGYTYQMDDFTFRAVEGGQYPKEMLLIATSDTRQEIAVIYFYNQDLDYIDDPLGKFIENMTGWEQIV